MNQGTATVAEPVDLRRAAVEAIVQSAGFRRSPRLRDLLLHICEATLEGNFDELTETRIAATVFHRPDYNSAEDNLVRVSARQLRSKIAEYYDGEGRNDRVIVDVPKGGYLAVFQTRPEAAVPTVAPAPATALPARSNSRTARMLTLVLAGLATTLLLITGWLWNQYRHLLRPGAPANQPALFDLVVSPNGPRTNLVITDSALVLLEQIRHQYVPLQDYATRRYLQSSPDVPPAADESGLMTILRSRQISSLADFNIVSAVLRRYTETGADLSIRHARNMEVRDFDTGDNFVLIGSSRSNPWASLFEKPLAFHLQSRYGSSCFEAVQTVPGHNRLYCSQDPANEAGVDFAHVAMLHTGNGRGRVLLIAGADMEGTEAAGLFVLNAGSVQLVLNALHARRMVELPDFELLLKCYSVAGSGRSPELVYARPL